MGIAVSDAETSQILDAVRRAAVDSMAPIDDGFLIRLLLSMRKASSA